MKDFENDVPPSFLNEFSSTRGRSIEDKQKSIKELNRLYI